MDVCVLGAGYVGLVVGVCLSDRGLRIRCVDVNESKIASLNSGKVPIYEPGLDEILLRNAALGRLTFGLDTADAISKSDVVYIAVGTPMADDGSADLTWVKAAADQIAASVSRSTLVIIKSTVPIGTADMVLKRINAHTDLVYDVVSNPEFLREGSAIPDFENPDRIVVGHRTPEAKEKMLALYASFVEAGHPLYFMDNRSAELTKYAANALLATKISFMNELSKLCDLAGADIESVRVGAGSDNRIGPKFLNAGVGYGGSCFPKDVNALMKMASKAGMTLQIGTAVESVNAAQKGYLVEKIHRRFGSDLTGKTFAIWGLAFKPETDDIREAPALTMIDQLLSSGAKIQAHDPEAMENVRDIYGDKIQLTATAMAAVKGADALLLVTEWSQYKNPDWTQIKSGLATPVIYDGRNLYDPASLTSAGFEYQGIGRGAWRSV